MNRFRRDAEFAFIPVQMEVDKVERVANAAQIIGNMCKLDRSKFQAELMTSSETSSDTKSISAQTKLDNESQGKTMKYFLSKRVHLIDGSDDYVKALVEADECTRLVQELSESRNFNG